MIGALLAAALVNAGPAAEARFEANTTIDPHLGRAARAFACE